MRPGAQGLAETVSRLPSLADLDPTPIGSAGSSRSSRGSGGKKRGREKGSKGKRGRKSKGQADGVSSSNKRQKTSASGTGSPSPLSSSGSSPALASPLGRNQASGDGSSPKLDTIAAASEKLGHAALQHGTGSGNISALVRALGAPPGSADAAEAAAAHRFLRSPPKRTRTIFSSSGIGMGLGLGLAGPAMGGDAGLLAGSGLLEMDSTSRSPVGLGFYNDVAAGGGSGSSSRGGAGSKRRQSQQQQKQKQTDDDDDDFTSVVSGALSLLSPVKSSMDGMHFNGMSAFGYGYGDDSAAAAAAMMMRSPVKQQQRQQPRARAPQSSHRSPSRPVGTAAAGSAGGNVHARGVARAGVLKKLNLWENTTTNFGTGEGADKAASTSKVDALGVAPSPLPYVSSRIKSQAGSVVLSACASAAAAAAAQQQ